MTAPVRYLWVVVRASTHGPPHKSIGVVIGLAGAGTGSRRCAWDGPARWPRRGGGAGGVAGGGGGWVGSGRVGGWRGARGGAGRQVVVDLGGWGCVAEGPVGGVDAGVAAGEGAGV